MSAPAPGPGDPSCPHPTRTNGICDVCGQCEHDVILNAACFYCGSTDIDPHAISPKKLPDVIAPDRLVRKESSSRPPHLFGAISNQIAGWMDQVVNAPTDVGLQEKISGEIRELCAKFPAPGIMV